MCLGKDVEENETLQISSQQKLINSKEVEILGIKIDRKLSFHQHQKHFQEGSPKTKCNIEKFLIP